MSDILKHGLALAAQGIPVFFCNSDKSPACPRGFYAATTDPGELAELFRKYPGPLIGARTGAESHLDVLDLDLEHASAAAWWDEHRGQMPMTRMHQTRSGGLHVLFRHAAGLRNSTSKIARGVDTRAGGGYCIWWPSAGFPVLCDAPIAEWPEWLLADLARRPTLPPIKHTVSYTLDYRRLAGLVTTVAQATEGSRNCALYWASRRLAEHPGERSFGAEVLITAAVRAGLPEIEARRTVRSGLGGAI